MVESARPRARGRVYPCRAGLIDSPREGIEPHVKIHLNGILTDERDAHISVLDRGFLFGDGVYELIRYFDGFGVGLEAHAQRLARSLALARITGFDALTLPELCADLLKANGLRDAVVYLQVTRGAGRIRSHVPNEPLTPTIVAIATPSEAIGSLEQPQEIAAITTEDLRWKICEIKTISLMGNILHLLDADTQSASEAILHRDGFVGEGAYSNVALSINGTLVTPPVADDPPILHGTARVDLLAAAQQCGIPTEIRRVTRVELATANEVMITSSRRFVSAVTRLDGESVGSGSAGPMTRALFETMRDEIVSQIAARAVPLVHAEP